MDTLNGGRIPEGDQVSKRSTAWADTSDTRVHPFINAHREMYDIKSMCDPWGASAERIGINPA
jgi:hypothetical protein